jgi:RsiW-degrading membrane proteinase PrsW (M82 family)
VTGQASAALRHGAVEVIAMTAMIGTCLAIAPMSRDVPDVPWRLSVAFGASIVAAIAAFVLASLVIEHKSPDWRRYFFERAHYDETYEVVAAIAMIVLYLAVSGLLMLLTGSGPFVPIVGGAYVGNVARSLILAGGRATQRS